MSAVFSTTATDVLARDPTDVFCEDTTNALSAARGSVSAGLQFKLATTFLCRENQHGGHVGVCGMTRQVCACVCVCLCMCVTTCTSKRILSRRPCVRVQAFASHITAPPSFTPSFFPLPHQPVPDLWLGMAHLHNVRCES